MNLSSRVGSWGTRLHQHVNAAFEAIRRQPLPAVIAVLWFALTYSATIWVWGVTPKMFASPDEALNRFAASLLAKQGQPFVHLLFPDPEDLAHPRHWVTLGDHAVPSYAPVAIYGYGLLQRLHGLGWVSTLPAFAASAFALGMTKLLPRGRQWLALPAPMLGFPAIYWLTRPWMNLSVLVNCTCWAFFFWASWRKSQRLWQLGVAIGWVGLAAAVRPDYAAYLMLITLLLGLAQAPAQWRKVVVFVLVAGGSAVALNLFLNWLITGHPTVAAYQIVAARDEPTGSPGGLVGLLRQLVIPMGVPTPSRALGFLTKYWIEMGTIAGLSVGLIALIPLLAKQAWLPALLHVLAIVVMLCFVLSRMDPDLNGASERVGFVHHSMPRYWSPIYLLATLPPALYLGHCRNRAVFAIGSVAICLLALSGGYEIAAKERAAFTKMKAFVNRSNEALQPLRARIPSRAMVYSVGYDKILWSNWRVGTIGDPALTARSMRRALDAGVDVFVYEPVFERWRYDQLMKALAGQQINMIRITWQGLYHLKRKPAQP